MRLRLVGEFDLALREALTAAVVEAAGAAGASGVVVDLAETNFLDSAGIAALVAGYHAARRAAREYAIVNAHGTVAQVLQLTGVFLLVNGPGATT